MPTVVSVGKDVVAFAIATVLAVILPLGPPSASRAGESMAAHTGTYNPPSPPGTSDEAPFLAENDAAMDKMMADMAVKPTGDVDRDFVAMMVPHHQGAIDMAQAELRYGHNEQLRRMAQEIVVEQQQEIAAMRLALGEPCRPPPLHRPKPRRPLQARRHRAPCDVPRFHEHEIGACR